MPCAFSILQRASSYFLSTKAKRKTSFLAEDHIVKFALQDVSVGWWYVFPVKSHFSFVALSERTGPALSGMRQIVKRLVASASTSIVTWA